MSQYQAQDFSFVKTNKSLTIHFKDSAKTVLQEESMYDLASQALEQENWEELVTLLWPEDHLLELTREQMKVEHGQVFVMTPQQKWWPIPANLNKTILLYIERGWNFTRLVNFAINLSRNPSMGSVQQLFLFLDKNKFTITPEGKFIAYKSIRNDYKDTYTGTFDNSPGAEPRVSRDQVNDDPTVTCSHGLHVSNLEYCTHHYTGDIRVYVEVDPADVVAVPIDYKNAKMRTCGYKVLGVVKGEEFESGLYDPGVTEQIWEDEGSL